MRPPAFLLVLTLAACSVPPPDAFVSSTRDARQAQDVGRDTQGGACFARAAAGTVGGRTREVYCAGWTQPAARVTELDGPSDPGRLAAIAAGGAWRTALAARANCDAPEPTMIAGSRPGLMLSCRRRAGGWPHVALVVAGPRGPVMADGLPAALPAMEVVISGTGSTRAARSAAMQAAVARLAADAFGPEQVGRYEALITLGGELNQSENFAAAADAYRAALAIQEPVLGRAHPDSVTATVHLALNLSNLGRHGEAAPLFAQASRLAPAAQDRTAVARVLHYRGLDAANRHDGASAAQHLADAERAYAALLPPDLLQPRRSAGSDAAALTLDATEQSALLGLVEVRRNRAVALGRAGHPEEAARLAADGRALMERAGFNQQVVLGRSFRTEGKARQDGDAGVQELYSMAVSSFAAAQPGERPEAATLFLSGARLADAGRKADALQAFRRGADLLRARQLGLDVATVQPYLDLLQAGANADPELGAELFAAMQLARRDGTARLTAQASARLAAGGGNERVTAALRTMQEADRQLRALLLEREAPGGARDPALPGRIADARRIRDDAEEQAAAAAPGYRQLLSGAVTAEAAAASLAANEALFTMLAGPSHSHVALLRSDGRTLSRVVALGEADMAALVARVRRSLNTGREVPFDMEAAYALHEALIAPLAPLLDGADALVVVADGPMTRIPFALLPARPGAGPDTPWLVRRFAVSHMPSPQTLATLRQAPGASQAPLPYAGFADPVTLAPAFVASSFPADACGNDARVVSLPALPSTRPEVSVAGRLMGAGAGSLWLGQAFTPAAVRAAELGRRRVIHFATHAILPGGQSCLREPALLASAPRGAGNARAAMLTASDILDMRLDADLVILSACNTAAGPDVGEGAGEGLAGLARAFFYAGTRGVLATHWAVDDLASAVTIADFLQRQRRGVGGAEALREVQLALIEGAGGRFPATFAHPAWWAPFALIGDGRRERLQVAGR